MNTVEQSALDELSVALVEYMLVNKVFPLGARQIKIIDVKHLITVSVSWSTLSRDHRNHPCRVGHKQRSKRDNECRKVSLGSA